jgi:UPF0271 protein
VRPTLNIDLGELDDEPEALYALAHAANVACGGHAGDAGTMARALDRCRLHGTKVGAHPAYPDRAAFGRRSLALSPAELGASLRAQCLTLAEAAAARRLAVAHAKLHGALYHDANARDDIAAAAIEAITEALGEVAIVGATGGALASQAQRRGLAFLREGFADRGYRPDGSIVPRSEPGALLTDPAAVRAQVRSLVARGDFDTLCVHGDGPNALAVARAAREELDA